MNKMVAMILTGLCILSGRAYSAIIEKSDCLGDGQACMVTTTTRSGSTDVARGTCKDGECRVPSVIMIRNDASDRDTKIICSVGAKKITVMPGQSPEWIDVAPEQELVCIPRKRGTRSHFGAEGKKNSLSVSPTGDTAFAWNGQQWIALGQRIVD